MPFSDFVQSISSKVLPEKRSSLPLQSSTTGVGIGNGGHVPFEDDRMLDDGYLVFLLFIPFLWTIWIWMIVSKPAIIFHTSQVFFNFLAMCCFASVAAFQAKWKIGPSGLSGFAIFVSVAGIVYSFFLLFVPVVYEKYDKGARLARALKEIRVGFILTGAGVTISLLISFITTISAFTQPGCKNAANDPHAKDKGKDFQAGLPGWCSTKKAGAIFFWLTFVFWIASLVLIILEWRSGKNTRARDPPFNPPEDVQTIDEEDSVFEHPMRKNTYELPNSSGPFSDSNRYSEVPSVGPSFTSEPPVLPRPSIDAYGAFSDPAPSGFAPPSSPPPDPRMSRTMQYADPYARVRTAVQGAPAATSPPSYSSYPGY